MREWAGDFLAGRKAKLERSVAADLARPDVHVLAANVWLRVQESLGRSREQAIAAAPEAGRARVEAEALIELLEEQGRPDEMLRRFPAARLPPLSPFALFSLSVAADQLGRLDESLAYRLARIGADPGGFAGVWDISDHLDADKRDATRRAVLARIESPDLQGTPAARFVRRVIDDSGLRNLDKLILAQDLWQQRPDWHLIRYRANGECELSRPEQCAQLRREAEALYPFAHSAIRVAVAMMKAGQGREARVLLRERALLFAPPGAPALRREMLDLVTALGDAGEYGEQRQLLDESLPKFPDEIALHLAMAELESTSARPAKAAEQWREVLRLAPKHVLAWKGLIQAHRTADDPDGAVDLWRQARTTLPEVTPALVKESLEMLQARGKHAEALADGESALVRWPDSPVLLRTVASSQLRLGQIKAAREKLEHLIAVAGADKDSAMRLLEIADKESAAAGDALLTQLQVRYPHSAVLADVEETRLSARYGTDRSAIRRATDAAIARAPSNYWPYFYRAWEAMLAKDAEGMHAVIARGLAAVPSDLPGRRMELIAMRAQMTLRMEIDANRPSIEALDQAASDLNQAEALGVAASYVAKWRADLLRKRGDEEGSARQLVLLARLSPDNKDPIDGLIRSSNEYARKHVWSLLDHYVKRNPHAPDRLELALMIHALWGGSPVVALAHARALEDRFPEHWRKGRGPGDKQFAMQHLGLFQQFYREQYDRHSSIAPAERYVGWFNDARSKAQGDTSFLLPEKLDLVGMRATIVGADGIEVERAWHPVSGKLTYVRVGRAEMQARYDEGGINLLGLKDSTGVELRLDYNALDQIVRFTRTGGEDILFEYGANGKPVRIAVKGVGEIRVSYDEQNEISKVDSSGGAKIALKVTQAFQQLLSQVKAFSAAQSEFPELPFEDKTLGALMNRALNAKGPARTTEQLAVAEYLVAHVSDRRNYAGDAKLQLETIYELESTAGVGAQANGLRAVVLWHRLVSQVYRHGVSESDLQKWAAMQTWLDLLAGNQKLTPTIVKLRADIARSPLGLMESARWLPRSYVDNPGFWRRHPIARVLPERVAQGAVLSSLLVRRNGDVVVGSARGLSVLRRGFWEWFGYDREARQLSANLEPSGEQPAVLALSEDSAGHLWIGLDNALLRIDGDYDGELVRFASAIQGLANPRVEQLVPFGDAMLVGTAGGLRLFGMVGNIPLPVALKPLETIPIRLLRAGFDKKTAKPPRSRLAATLGGDDIDAETKAPTVLIGTEKSLIAFGQGSLQPLAGYAVQDARYHAGRIYALRNNEVLSRIWPVTAQGGFERVPDAGNIQFARSIDGLGEILLDDGTPGLAVLTDLGISIYHNSHFEHKKLPLADRDVAVLRLANGSGKTILSTSDGIYALQAAQGAGDTRGMVHDLLTMPEHGATFVARGNTLEAVVHAEAKQGARTFARLHATHLARDRQGGLIANDGNQIVRIAPGTTDVVELFAAPGRDHEGNPTNRGIRSLVVASDGSIWVATGASLFRYLNGQTSEFSIFLDEKVFPARSNMISRVIETMDRKIWVIASDEGHLYHRGRPMIGGLLEWDGRRFISKTDEPSTFPKFINSYTVVGPDRAIIGTPSGFASQSGDRHSSMSGDGDVSYNMLSQRQPMLFLGTRGAAMGDDSWFFGTAGGIVAWHAGRWIFPDRLNWQLPDQHLSNYGARTVHAVATDNDGRIYAGTDRGLMIYHSGGNDFLQFVLSENLPDIAFAELESGKLRAESRALLDKLPRDSPAAQLVKAHSDSLAGIAAARIAINTPKPPLAPVAKPAEGATQKTGLAEELERRERAHKELLSHLEKDSYALYQMLELKPIDLSVWRKRLHPGDVIVQYLPTRDRLLIHLASRDRTEIREVQIGSEELFSRSQAVANVLAAESRRLRGIRGATSQDGNLSVAELAGRGVEGLQQELHWLYQQLLRPVEADLASYKHVYITPVGALSHLPFGALVRSRGATPEYAAQRYQLGILPSLYLLDLVLNAGDRSLGGTVLFGNPDGTLRGAERETRAIGNILGPSAIVRIGNEASAAALRENARGARWLHLATHGHLNGEDPSQSYLILSNGTRFTMIDAMQLSLEHTETVVLSACESGVGASGLDYATLSRAFAYAGATSVVASLWLVNDDATEMLMTRFYTHRKDGKNVFLALAAAQRDMIARGGAAASPAAWSSFLAFGRP